MKLTDMLAFYRNKAQAPMQAIANEFKLLSEAEQRELLFWMTIDVASNPTRPAASPGRLNA